MKVAVHMSMFCKKWTDDIRPMLPKVKELGFDGVEVSLYGAEKSILYDVFSLCHDLGLDLMCGTGITLDTDISSSSETVRKQGIEYLRESVEIAYEGGAKALNGVLYAPWKAFGEGDRYSRWERSSLAIRDVVDATDGKLNLNLEVLNRFETDFMNTLEEGVSFLSLVDRPIVRLLADTFHMNIEESNSIEALDTWFPYLGYVHVCANHRGVPGTGHIPFKDILKVLSKKGYDGYLTIESIARSGSEVANGMSVWRDLGKDELIQAQKGLKFLRDSIEECEHDK